MFSLPATGLIVSPAGRPASRHRADEMLKTVDVSGLHSFFSEVQPPAFFGRGNALVELEKLALKLVKRQRWLFLVYISVCEALTVCELSVAFIWLSGPPRRGTFDVFTGTAVIPVLA